MTGSGAERNAPVSGSGCGTAIGIGLILAGAIFLGANLLGTRLALFLVDLLPIAAVWWPLLLVVWGLFKILGRLRGKGIRFGILEVLFLLLVAIGGTGLTVAYRVIESQGLQFRFVEMIRLAAGASGQFPHYAFATELAVSLPTAPPNGSPVEVVISLPAGNIVVTTSPSPEEGPGDPDGAEGGAAPAPATTETNAGNVKLSKRVWASNEAQAGSRAEAVRLIAGPLDSESGEFPIRVEDLGESEVGLELLVTLPAGVGVSARSGKGSVRVEGPFARVEGQTSEGPIGISGTSGGVSLTARDGAVQVSEIGGALQVRGRRAAIEIRTVAGPVTVESDGAPVWISGAGSSVHVRGRSAPVEVLQSAGPIEVETRISPITLDGIERSASLRSAFGPILAMSVGGPLRIRTESASVEVREARSDVQITGDGGTFVLAGIAGPVTVSSGRGEVRASDLLGPASFSGHAGAIVVRGFEDTLAVDADDVLVDVATGVLQGAVTLKTDPGEIRLTLPPTGSFTLSAETDGGDVESDFALNRTTAGGRSRWSGLAGAGAERITISTGGGDVAVRSGPDRDSSGAP